MAQGADNKDDRTVSLLRRIEQGALLFFIGLLATICATLLPRMVATLSLTADTDYLEFFKTDFLIVVSAFALLVGLVTVILEWGGARAPREVFVAALGIPALIMGTYSTTGGAADYADVAAQRDLLVKSLLTAGQISVEAAPSPPQLEFLSRSPPSGRSGLNFQLLGIRSAHAAPPR